MEDRSLILILLMSVVVAFSTLIGTLLIENWPRFVKAFWSFIGVLPLLAWITNLRRAPVPVEFEFLCFFAGVFTGTAILVHSMKVKSVHRAVCVFTGVLSAGASIAAGMVAVSIYFLP